MTADDLDCCSDAGPAADQITGDDDIAALVLFADVDFLDPAAVEARRLEWLEVLS